MHLRIAERLKVQVSDLVLLEQSGKVNIGIINDIEGALLGVDVIVQGVLCKSKNKGDE